MKNSKLLKLVIVILAAGLLVFLVLYSWKAVNTANNFIQGTRASAYSGLSFIGTFISELGRVKTLTEENMKLKDENREFLSRLAEQENLRGENDFLRDALNLDLPTEFRMSDAGVFNFQFTPEGGYLLINKGRREEIKKDDIIISSSGVLVGVVSEVFDGYSRVTSVINSDFKVTVKVLFKDTTGIARGAMRDGLYVDFISQNDEITEGDTIVTSGNDIFPSGLIIGKVIQVSLENGSLFKGVKVKPMIEELDLGRVLVLDK